MRSSKKSLYHGLFLVFFMYLSVFILHRRRISEMESKGLFRVRSIRSDQSSTTSDEKPPFVPMEHVDKDSRTLSAGHYVVTKGRRNVLEAVRRRAEAGIETPQILIWRSMSYLESNTDTQLEFLLGEQCGGCQVTTDRSTLDKSVAVALFNLPGILADLPDPGQRRPEQAYVFWTRETPSKTVIYKSAIAHPRVDSIFNLTMYFRRDSDIVIYFGNRELVIRKSKELERKGTLDEILGNKNKLAVWVVSNCYGLHGANTRMEYAKKLKQSGLNFDVFGDCSNSRQDGPLVDQFTEYKFYFAFENSIHCPDYVTEKLWRNSLEAGLVPVVFGPTKEDVSAVAPANSFIHAEDFASPAELARYLNYLDSNETAYMQYHEWRKQQKNDSIPPEEIAKDHQPAFCRLCRRQVLEKHPPKTIPSISKWLYETRYVDNECLKPRTELSDEERRAFTNWI